MDVSDKKLKAHLFVCTSCTYNQPNGSESDPAIAADLRKSIKTEAYEKFGKDRVRVSAVGCLGQCSDGIATVLYPQGEWLLNVRPEDKAKLIKKIEENCRD